MAQMIVIHDPEADGGDTSAPLDTAGYSHIVVSCATLAGAETVAIKMVCGDQLIDVVDSAGTAKTLTATITQLRLDGGPTYVFVTSVTVETRNVYVDFGMKSLR